MIEINTRWFLDPNRTKLIAYLAKSSNDLTELSKSLMTTSSPTETTMVELAKCFAQISVLTYIDKCCATPDKTSWLMVGMNNTPMSLDKFKEEVEKTMSFLQRGSPFPNIISLVHIQHIIKLLTTMEFTDGR